MLNDAKWLDYAIKTLKAIHTGTNTISDIADEIGGSPSYIAKVVAVLRHANIIDSEYSISKPINQLTIREVLESNRHYPSDALTSILLDALNVPISRVW